MNSQEFQVGKHGIGWLDSDFKTHFDGQTFEPAAAAPTFRKLGRNMKDSEIESELKPGYCTLGDVYAFLQNPPQGSKDGWGNLFYFPQCVVNVRWDAGDAEWFVSSWQRGGGEWSAESRVFSPATGPGVLGAQNSVPQSLSHFADTDAFIDALREQILKNCEGKSAAELAQILFEVTDQMEAGGIDDAWDTAKLSDRKAAGNVFCITWLTMIASGLKIKSIEK